MSSLSPTATITSELRHAHVHGPLSHPFNRDRWRWMDVGGPAA